MRGRFDSGIPLKFIFFNFKSMQKNKLVQYSFLHSLGTVIFIFLVALLMSNGNKLFGNANNVFGGTAILLLFVLSATVVSSLVLGKPILLYWDGEKRIALQFFAYTVLWLLLWLFLFLAIMTLF